MAMTERCLRAHSPGQDGADGPEAGDENVRAIGHDSGFPCVSDEEGGALEHDDIVLTRMGDSGAA